MADENYKVLLEQQTKLLAAMQTQMQVMQQQMGNMMSGSTIDAVKSHVSVPWPQPLDVESGDLFENFEFFRNGWENYCTATGMSKWGPEKSEVKASILLSAVGSAAVRKFMDFGLTEKEKKCEKEILKKMEETIIKKTNVIYSRYLFNSRNQLSEETFEDYFLALKKLERTCGYGTMADELMRDRLVVGIKDGEVIKELLRKEDLTLDSALNICRAAERAITQLADLKRENVVNKINTYNKKDTYKNKDEKKMPRRCKFCGDNHVFNKNKCPAFGKRCEECGGRNHFQRVCKKKNTRINEINENMSYTSDESIVIAQVRTNKSSGHIEAPLMFNIKDKWNKIYCTLDTGAQVCVMGAVYYKKITGDEGFRKLTPSSKKLKCFNGSAISQYGTVVFECMNKEKKIKIKFHIVDVQHEPLLSEKACVAFGFIKYCEVVKSDTWSDNGKEKLDRTKALKIIQKYDDVFNGYGELPGEVNLEVDTSVIPKIQPARRVPVCLRNRLQKELEQLIEDGIIVKETQHTDWVNNILIVSKDSKFRICLDPIPLNKALKRPNFQFTTLDEMLPELSKARVFSTVDAKKGFWQCRLAESSSKLTTFWTPFGRYRWLRLPFGLCSSPEIFQQQLTSLLKDLKGIEIIADDILIYGVGDTIEEATIDHNIKLESLLKRLQEVNCKLNKEKVNLLQTSVKFYGHILSKDGLKVDESKVEAIKNMPTPTSSKDVLRFLGMVGYLSKFINNLSMKATNLRKLTRKDTEFVWSEKEETEFQNLKNDISNLPVLQYFDINKEVVIECDASEYGLGAALYQNNQIICFASRCLTPTEKKYAQIEKEMLAVVFACKRFNQYVAGNSKTIIKTDHRPLINITNKPLIEAPKRLQMMLLTLQKYNVQLEFIQGKDNLLADTLSRAPVRDDKDTFYNLEEKIKERKVYKLISKVSSIKYLKVSDKLLCKIRKYTEKDQSLQQLIDYIQKGFPKYISGWPITLSVYFSFKHELSSSDGLVFRNNQVLIPELLRKELTQKVHVSHNGIASTLRLARENIFWPGMSEDIKQYIEKCSFCIEHSPSQQNQPLICHDIPLYPFQYISMDVFTVNDIKYLVTVDHYSDYFELDKLNTLSANETVVLCKKNFARHGVPQKVCTDNATNFVNEVFKSFADQWNFEHVTSSPHHPESNGKAESAVKIAKKLVVQSQELKQDLWYCLLHHRNVPIQMDNTSPVQKLFSRRTRTGLPCLLHHLKPRVVTEVPKKIKEKKERIKEGFDKRSRTLRDLLVGQKVVTQLHPEVNKKWSFGTITKRLNERSYIVIVGNKEYRRSRCHIKPFPGEAGSKLVGRPTEHTAEYRPHNNDVTFSGVDMFCHQHTPNTESQFHVRESPVQPSTSDTTSVERPEESSRLEVRRSHRSRNLPRHLADYEVYFIKKRGCL